VRFYKALWQGLRRAARVVRELHRHFYLDRCQLLAAAVSFYMILLGVPLMLLGVALLGYVVRSPESAYGLLQKATEYFLPPALSATGESLHRAVQLPTLRWATGGFSLLLLLWAGLRLFETLEWALTALWPKGRSYARRQLVALASLVLAGALAAALGAGSGVVAGLQRTIHIGAGLPPGLHHIPWLSQVFSAVVALLIFFVVYYYLPPVKISPKAALLGALIAALCWALSQYGFALVVGRVIDPSAVYGQMTAAVVLVWWVYFSAVILFLGAEIVKMYQNALNGEPTLPLRSEGDVPATR